jgi:riboflavin kinase / FMN adenylyltransferase
MKVHSDIHKLPAFKNAVITIGTFDGVHTGHLEIIRQLKEEAVATDGETVIITFQPHPRMILNSIKGKTESIKLLNTLPEKIELLERQEIDHLVVVPFTREFSEQPADAYILDFLVGKFHPHTVIIGYDHRFGKDRQGDYTLLESYQGLGNFIVKEIPEYVLNDIVISSTRIRKALGQGDILTANMFLGYPYFFEGKVIEGDKLGRKLGYPTANIEINNINKLIPANGIYAVQVFPEQNSLFKGMMNIGFRPTVGGTKRTLEVNIFDFNGDLYGKTIRVFMKHFLRNEEKFADLEALKSKLAEDKIYAEKLLEDY